MVTSAEATALALILPLWCQCALATQVAFSNFSADNGVRSSFIERRLRSQERREMQREILSILGLPHRPRPQVHVKHNAAPMFMMDLYNTISAAPQPAGYAYYQPVLPTQVSPMVTPQESRFLDDADMVMSFVNLGKITIRLLRKSYWVTSTIEIRYSAGDGLIEILFVNLKPHKTCLYCCKMSNSDILSIYIICQPVN